MSGVRRGVLHGHGIGWWGRYSAEYVLLIVTQSVCSNFVCNILARCVVEVRTARGRLVGVALAMYGMGFTALTFGVLCEHAQWDP